MALSTLLQAQVDQGTAWPPFIARVKLDVALFTASDTEPIVDRLVSSWLGFTLIELLVVIAIIAALATLTFVDERVETINDGSFALHWAFQESAPDTWRLRDKPGASHSRGANLAFADGHVEYRRWEDARTAKAPRDDVLMPGNTDILWLQQHATWRE